MKATARRLRGRRYRSATKMNAAHMRYLKKIVDADPSLFLDEMQKRLRRKFGQKFSIPTIHKALTTKRRRGGLGYSLKLLTFKAVQASRKERRLYRARLRQVNDPRQFVFIDETAVGRNAGRRRR